MWRVPERVRAGAAAEVESSRGDLHCPLPLSAESPESQHSLPPEESRDGGGEGRVGGNIRD